MPSDAKRSPERGAFDWLNPIPSDPDRDPYYIRAFKQEDRDTEDSKTVGPTLAAYAYLIKRGVEVDWMKMIDTSWFVADWHGAPRWKWGLRIYVALIILIGPALALFGWVVLGWYR